MTNSDGLKRELVIPVRTGVSSDVEIAIERLRDEGSRTIYERALVFIVSAVVTEADEEIERVRAQLPSEGLRCEVFAPPEFRRVDAQRETSALIRYLAETRPAKMGRESFVLSIIQQPAWPELGLACGVVLTLRPEVQLVDPSSGHAYRPAIDESLARRLDQRTQPTGIPFRHRLIGSSTAMKTLRATLERYASLPFPVLLEGETGVGKELCAGFIHEASGRKGSLIAVNGALLDPARAEDELCGHVKSAFTGADAARTGRIREADKGTFFLDELLAVPASIQPMLLRTFNHAMDGELEVTPLGQEKSHRLDVRLITAVQPLDETATSPVRDDLLFRVQGLHVVIPPLRERGDDVLEIAENAIENLYTRHKHGARRLDRDAASLLRGYPWPGNVRQLHGVIRRAWASNAEVSTLSANHIRPLMPAARMTRGLGLRGEVHALVTRRVDEARRAHPRSENEAARSLGFDKGQAMTRYLTKCENDAAEGRRRKSPR